MIDVLGAQKIVDEEERRAALAVVAQRAAYYAQLFAEGGACPRITLQYEGVRPLRIRIKFMPPGAPPVIIDAQSYARADAATKYALKKLRRVAKNYFVKTKKRHRQ